MIINAHRGSAVYLFVGLCLGLAPLHSKANGLIGTSVTGSLIFTGNPNNYYDPANGYVPSSGYLNSAGTTVTIASPPIEFGFADATNTDTADFSASQFTIEDTLASTAGGSDNPWTMTFTDTAFAGQSLAKATDFFPNGGVTYSLVGSKITIAWAGGPVNANDDYTSTFVVKTIPEPSTGAAVALGASALTLVLRRKRHMGA